MLLFIFAVAILALRYVVGHTGIDIWVQEICVSSLGAHSNTYYQALICGQKLSSATSHLWFQHWGLLHILVVSGAHFVFLEQHLSRSFRQLKLPEIWAAPLLILFSFATGLGPPVLRSTLALILRWSSNYWKYHWSHPQICLLAGVFSLLYVPPKQHLSLQLSWAAALMISWPVQKSFLDFKRLALMWLGMLPLLTGLSWTHPLTILANGIFLPFFDGILFPLVWVDQNLLRPWIALTPPVWTENLWKLFPRSLYSPSPDTQFKWLYLILLQALALKQRRLRKEDL